MENKKQKSIYIKAPLFTKRILTTILDILIMSPITAIFLLIIKVIFYKNNWITLQLDNYNLHIVVSLILIIGYSSFMEASNSKGTIGSMLFGIMTVSSKTGNKISIFRSIIRNIIKYFFLPLVLCVYVMILISIYMTPIYDKLSGVKIRLRKRGEDSII